MYSVYFSIHWLKCNFIAWFYLKKDRHNNLIRFGSLEISELMALSVIGEIKKVEEFLQGQATSDISLLSNNNCQLSSICNHKGQVLADFIVYKINEEFKIIINKNLKDTLIDELKPFAQFSSIEFKAGTEKIIGSISDQKDSSGVYNFNDEYQLKIELKPDTFVLKNEITFEEWAVANKFQGILFLDKEDIEKYRPLEINFDKLRVSFDKGCYRGQEIVARMKYLGIDRRKFCTFIAKDVFKGSSDIKILGKIVKIGNKKVFNAIVKKDLINQILKLHDLEEVI